MEQTGIYYGIWKILIQSLLWGALWLFVPLLFTDSSQYDAVLTRGLVTFAGILLVVGINLQLLLPQLFFRRQYLWYGLTAILLVILLTQGVEYIQQHWMEPYFAPNDGVRRLRPGDPRPRSGRFPRASAFRWFRTLATSMPYLLALVGSALFEIALYANRQEREAIRLRNEKLETEMKFLKSQINPHFLFNALNNIYTLTVLKSDAAPDHLLKLSNMLRYMLYECNTDRVPLQKEVEYIRNYIDLKMLKDSAGLNVETNLQEKYPNLLIAPLLFIPFVENAFKHSQVEDLEKGWIRIGLRTEGRQVFFSVENSVSEAVYTKDRVGGIGLKNVERQLELLYPGRHTLHIEQDDIMFKVELSIEL